VRRGVGGKRGKKGCGKKGERRCDEHGWGGAFDPKEEGLDVAG
jgi:hypothetical protein